MSADTACAIVLIALYFATLGVAARIVSRKDSNANT